MPRKKIKIPSFNPLDKINLAESVVRAMLKQPVNPLPPQSFMGAGIYAIYYKGDFPLYDEIVKRNQGDLCRQPIYVGKAGAGGSRKGGMGLDETSCDALYKRLGEHARSIKKSSNLNIEDFSCRFLVVDSIWIPLAESLLIDWFKPLWNCLVDGFGNHDPGEGRRNQKISMWDTIHMGRSWTDKLPKHQKSEAELKKAVRDFIAANYNG